MFVDLFKASKFSGFSLRQTTSCKKFSTSLISQNSHYFFLEGETLQSWKIPLIERYLLWKLTEYNPCLVTNSLDFNQNLQTEFKGAILLPRKKLLTCTEVYFEFVFAKYWNIKYCTIFKTLWCDVFIINLKKLRNDWLATIWLGKNA